MRMDLKELLKLIEDDKTGILSIKSKNKNHSNANDRLISSFQEINNFIREEGREPKVNTHDIQEFKLHSRLKTFKEDDSKAKIVKEYDEFSLLNSSKKITSLQDIFNDDDSDFFKDDPNSIFNLTHVPKTSPASPDYIARRKTCKDFFKYEHLLKQCQTDLSIGKRKIRSFKQKITNPIQEGLFFILKGVLLYVAKVGPSEVINGHTNARLRCIFDNGTESDMLMRSLEKELYKNGRIVTELEDKLLDEFDNISPEDTEAGCIYVVKSLSDKPAIASIKNLYKIGFSQTNIKDRLKNAYQDPTFLMAPVKPIISYKCFNMNPQKLELLLHRFFGKACLDIDIFDEKGKRCNPREWFIAPLHAIEQAIHLILNGTITKYHYEVEQQEIMPNNLDPIQTGEK
ncbi:MAG: hypothetical protein K940chlam4_00013 [Candidatus Anoxychlamydiales bacterium]|nr:hypothetical protein [Candidatus Anoxychlamydiales bacterium]